MKCSTLFLLPSITYALSFAKVFSLTSECLKDVLCIIKLIIETQVYSGESGHATPWEQGIPSFLMHGHLFWHSLTIAKLSTNYSCGLFLHCNHANPGKHHLQRSTHHRYYHLLSITTEKLVGPTINCGVWERQSLQFKPAKLMTAWHIKTNLDDRNRGTFLHLKMYIYWPSQFLVLLWTFLHDKAKLFRTLQMLSNLYKGQSCAYMWYTYTFLS